MNIKEQRELAAKLESNVGALIGDFNEILHQHGFGEFTVISFAIGHREAEHKLRTYGALQTAIAGSPCPTKCKVLPDGQIECRPDCS